MPHGTASCYKSGCRKEICRAAQKVYVKEYKLRVLRELNSNPEHPTHGKEFGYQAGCRCLKCKEGHRKSLHKHKETVPEPRANNQYTKGRELPDKVRKIPKQRKRPTSPLTGKPFADRGRAEVTKRYLKSKPHLKYVTWAMLNLKQWGQLDDLADILGMGEIEYTAKTAARTGKAANQSVTEYQIATSDPKLTDPIILKLRQRVEQES